MTELGGRLIIEVTPEQYRTLVEQAGVLGMKGDDLINQVVKWPSANGESGEFHKLLDQVNGSVKAACLAIDDALAFIAASNERIARMEVESPEPTR